jgi:hypothetical protein
MPAGESEIMPTRYKKQRQQQRQKGVRGRTVRRLNAGNIFNMRDPYYDPFSSEPNYSGIMELAFEARMMLTPKVTAQPIGNGGSIDASDEPVLAVLDLPPKTSTITKMGMQQMTKGYTSSAEDIASADQLLVLEPPPHVDSTTNSSKSFTSGKGKGKGGMMMMHPKLSKKSKTSMSALGNGMGMNEITEEPTYSPTLMPVQPQTLHPGQSPTPPTPPHPPIPMSCTVDGAGNWGIIQGDTTLYDFFYQLEVVPGLTAQQVDATLLGDVEVAMANAMIPGLFPQQCGRRRLQISAPTSANQFVGLSTTPPDFVLDSRAYSFAPHTF